MTLNSDLDDNGHGETDENQDGRVKGLLRGVFDVRRGVFRVNGEEVSVPAPSPPAIQTPTEGKTLTKKNGKLSPQDERKMRLIAIVNAAKKASPRLRNVEELRALVWKIVPELSKDTANDYTRVLNRELKLPFTTAFPQIVASVEPVRRGRQIKLHPTGEQTQ